jgi:hypothetical protein
MLSPTREKLAPPLAGLSECQKKEDLRSAKGKFSRCVRSYSWRSMLLVDVIPDGQASTRTEMRRMIISSLSKELVSYVEGNPEFGVLYRAK